MSNNRFASLTTGDDDDQVVESTKPAKQPKAKAAAAPASKFPGEQPAAKENKERAPGATRGGGKGGATRGRGRGGSRGGGAGGGGKREFDRQSGTGRKEGRSAQKNGYGGWGDDKGADDLAGQTKPEPTPSPAPDAEAKEAEAAAEAEALAAAEAAAEEEEQKLRLFADVQAEKERKKAEMDANTNIRKANNNTFKGAAGKELVKEDTVDPLFALGKKEAAPKKKEVKEDKPKALSVVEFSGHVPVQPKREPRPEGDKPRGKGKGGRGGKGSGKGKGKGKGKGAGKGGNNNTAKQQPSGPGYKVEGADFPALPPVAKN